MNKRIHIITGHYGSGKSEVSVNLAIEFARQGKNVVFADMDTINPYFRSNEARTILEQKGVTVMTTKFANTNVDIPAITGELSRYLYDKSTTLVMDVGGDDAGAKVVGYYRGDIPEQDTNLYFVVNCFRPETKSVEGVITILDEIRSAARMNVHYIINNSHIMEQTTEKELERGRDFAAEVSRITKIPIAFHAVMRHVENSLTFQEPVFYMDKTMGFFHYMP